ncbi:MAG TPA: hypothetical protein VLH75_04395 [Longimicrobiales bacterium]|nr:hypothetical protein [Longimicrobiales bacterium]
MSAEPLAGAAPGSGPAAGPGAPAVASRAWPFLLLALGLLGVGLAYWRPVPAGVWHDDGVYMVIGEALSQGHGLRYGGVPGELPAVKFPPLYPGLLGLLWVVLGSVGPVTLAAELLNLLLLAAAGGLLAWALHVGAGLRRREALAVGALAFISADVWRTALVPLSEPLFLALASAALALWPRASRRGEVRWASLLAALLVAVVLTRTAGVAVVAGFAVALTARRSVRAAAVVTAPALLAMAAWGAWASSRAAAIPEGLRDVLGPYGGWLAGQFLGSPGAFLAGLPTHANNVIGRVLALLVPGLTGPWLWVAAVPLGAAAVAGGWVLARRLPPLPWIALAYLGMLLTWPYVDRRLVAPLHPWLVVAVGVGVLDALRRLGAWSAPMVPRLRQALGVVALCWVVAFASVSAGRAARGWVVAPYQLRAGRLAAAVEVLQNTAPATAVVGAPEFWAALHLHGGWATAPSARFMPRSEDEAAPVWGTAEEQLALWWAVGVDHVLLEQGGQIHGAALDLLQARCPGSVAILARMPPQLVVRLSWDEACAASLGLRRREP